MKYVVVGDPHACPEELQDCENLMRFVKETVKSQPDPTSVLMLGDNYHHHGIVHLSVMKFWDDVFEDMAEYAPGSVSLVGNHDQDGAGNAFVHAMRSHRHQLRVVDQPRVMEGMLYMPYTGDADEFVKSCVANPTETLICHQTFEGSTYENGFYARDGVDPNLIPQKYVISGHIHTPQEFGDENTRVWYIGAPRWRTQSDANVARAIWLLDFKDGVLQSKIGFDTGVVCRQIRFVTDTPEDPVKETLDPRHDWRIDIRGPRDWIETRKTALSAPGVKVRTFCTDRAAPRIRESDGIDQSFRRFVTNYRPRYGTETERLLTLSQERVGVGA